MEELKTALSQLKVRKAGGLLGILPEMILHGGPALHSRLLTLMEAVCREGDGCCDHTSAQEGQPPIL